MAPTRPAVFTGSLIDGRYRIERTLGAGGVGTVYLAEHLETGSPVAVKILHAEGKRHEKHRERLVREVAVMSALRALNVVRVLDHGTHQDVPYSVMEYLPGEDLRERLQRETYLGWSEVREILRQIIHGLSAAQDFGVLHRDIKPSNVFLTRTDKGEPPRVKLLDFGLAKASDASSPLGKALTRVGTVMGTVCYLAPERMRGEPATIPSEVYSLGVLAFECLSGGPPLPLTNLTELIRRRLYEPPPSVRAQVPALPKQVDELLLRMMARDPARRFETLGQLEAALLAIPGGAPPTPRRSSCRDGAEPRPQRGPATRLHYTSSSTLTAPVTLRSHGKARRGHDTAAHRDPDTQQLAPKRAAPSRVCAHRPCPAVPHFERKP